MSVDYQYVVLRLVPRVEREEFVNVGVVLYSQEADFLQGAVALDDARALALDPGLDLEAVKSTGYAFQIELTYRALRRGLRVKEIPIPE